MLKRILPLMILGYAAFAQAQNAALGVYFCQQGGTQALTSSLKSANYQMGVVPYCQVTVYLTGTQTLATLYSNATGTPLSNPFTASSTGQFLVFAAPNQAYDVVLNNSSQTVCPACYAAPVTITDVSPGWVGINGVINVRENSYGYTLTNDGTTDNCAAWNALAAVVPSGSTLFFPPGQYYASPSTCSSGFVLPKPLTILGAGSGSWTGSAIAGNATIFLAPLNFNSQPGVTVEHVATDCRNYSTTVPCDGLSSGPTATTGGNSFIYDTLYVGPADYLTSAVQAHAVLLQSGPNNFVSTVRSWYVFHSVADRSSATTITDVQSWDSVDLVVKSASGSGSVDNVNISNVQCDGDATGDACGIYVTAQGASLETAGVAVNNVTVNNGAYCGVMEVDSGGSEHTVKFNNFTCRNMQNGFYSYFGDANVSNAMADNVISHTSVWIASGNGYQNTIAGAPVKLNDYYCTSVANCTVGNFNGQPQSSGWMVWTGNTNDAQWYTDGAIQGATTISDTAEYPNGSGSFFATKHTRGQSVCNGLPGEAVYGSVIAGARGAETLTQAACFGNDGTIYSFKTVKVQEQTGDIGVILIPESDSDAGNLSIGQTNHAQTYFPWDILHNGNFQVNGIVVAPFSQFTGYSGDGNTMLTALPWGTPGSGLTTPICHDVNGSITDQNCNTPARGVVTLAAGTATVSNSAACTPSSSCVYKISRCTPNSSTAIGSLSVGTIVAGTSFVINSLSATNTVVTGDVSQVCWQVN